MVKNLLNSLTPEKICSIDASTNSLAFAIFNNGNLVRSGKITFSGKNAYEKLSDAARKSKAFFEHFSKDIDAVVIEHTVFMNSPKTAADLALVQGALLGAIAQNRIRISGSINPIAWQTFIGNKKLTKEEKLAVMQEHPGKSVSWYKNYEREFRKQRTISFVNINYDKAISDNDVADAIGIGHYAIHNWGKIDK